MNTRTALLNSAESAARQRGYDGFSYADLAREVGIRKASIHHYFPKKADLALELLERYTAAFAAALVEIEATESSAGDKMRAYHALYRDALAEGAQLCLCVAFSAGRNSLPESVLELLNQFHADSIAWLTRILSAAHEDGSMAGLTDAEAEAHATLALMEGAQLVARAADSAAPFDRATAAFIARISAPNTH